MILVDLYATRLANMLVENDLNSIITLINTFIESAENASAITPATPSIVQPPIGDPTGRTPEPVSAQNRIVANNIPILAAILYFV